MKILRNLAGGLLLLSGVLHLISVALEKFEAASIITVFFGVVYLAIGFFLFRSGWKILWFGTIVPIVGMVLATLGMMMKPTPLGGIFIAIDIITAGCCIYLIFRERKKALSL